MFDVKFEKEETTPGSKVKPTLAFFSLLYSAMEEHSMNI